MRKLEWLVVKDNFLTETATFWNRAPEIEAGEVKPEDIETEVFFLPAAQVAETEGSFTNTQRMLQWHFKAADPPGALPLRSVVHPSARAPAEEAVRRERPAAGPGVQESDLGLRSGSGGTVEHRQASRMR